MEKSRRRKGFTYAELVAAIWVFFIIAVLISTAVGPGTVAVRSASTKALSDAKQIGLACKQFAIDNDGHYPSFAFINGTTSETLISDYSNTAFDQLFPTYLTTISIFYLPKSAWTPARLPDPTPTAMAAGTPSLPAGSNEWAYVAGLKITSDTRLPLIASGFADLKSHSYTTTETARGGVWKGRDAIVINCDDSARFARCDRWTHKVPGSPNGADLFDTSGQPGWLNSPGVGRQNVLNPR